MKHSIILLLTAAVWIAIADQNFTALWYDVKYCTEGQCVVEAEFNHVTNSGFLMLDNTTLGTMKYKGLVNSISLTRWYDVVHPSLTTLPVGIPSTYMPGYYMWLNNLTYSVFNVSLVDPSMQFAIQGRDYQISEEYDSRVDSLYFNPTHNPTYITQYNRSQVVVAWDKNSERHAILLCEVNKVGEHNMSKVGAFKKAVTGSFDADWDFTSAVQSGLTTLTVPLFNYDVNGVAFAITDFPILTYCNNFTGSVCKYPKTLPVVSGCNLQWDGFDVISNTTCHTTLSYGFDKLNIPIAFTRFTPLQPVFYLGGSYGFTAQNTSVNPSFKINASVPKFGRVLNYIISFSLKWFANQGSGTSLNVRACVDKKEVCSTWFAFSSNIGVKSVAIGNVNIIPNAALNGTDLREMKWLSNYPQYVQASANNISIVSYNQLVSSGSNNTIESPYLCIDMLNEDWDTYQGVTADLIVECNRVSPSTWSVYVQAETGKYFLDKNGTCLSTGSTIFSVNSGTLPQFVGQRMQFCVSQMLQETTSPMNIRITRFNAPHVNYNDTITDDDQIRFEFQPNGNAEELTTILMYNFELQAQYSLGYAKTIDTWSSINNCQATPFMATGGYDSNYLHLQEQKLTNNSLADINAIHQNIIDDFDPDINFSGLFVVNGNGWHSCYEFTSLTTDQTSKDTVKVTVVAKDTCLSGQNINITILNNDEYFLLNNGCVNKTSGSKCHLTLKLLNTDNFVFKVVGVTDDSLISKSSMVKFDWSESCVILCEIPYFRDLPEWVKGIILIGMMAAAIFFMISVMYPIYIVIMCMSGITRLIISLVWTISKPFRWCFYQMMDVFKGFVQKKKEQYNRLAGNDGSQTPTFSAPPRNNSSIKGLMCILLLGITIPQSVYGCNLESLTGTNITTCAGGECNTKLDVPFSLFAEPNSQLCVIFQSVETQLGEQPIVQESLNITVVDFQVEYELNFAYYGPWSVDLKMKTTCECADSSDHSCNQNKHPSHTNCDSKANLCDFKSTRGDNDNCEALLMFGDGHYCTSYSFVEGPLVSVSYIDPVPYYKMLLEVCQNNGTLVCERVWHNTTKKETFTMFDSQVRLLLEGYLMDQLPNLAGYKLIKTGGQSWISRVNDLGNYEPSNPGFIQKYNSSGVESWHWKFDLIEPLLNIAHHSCWTETKVTYTNSIPMFYSYLDGQPTAKTYFSRYGQIEVTGWGPTARMVLHPLSGPEMLGEIITNPGWIQIEIDSACPVIDTIGNENLFKDSSLGSVTVFGYSTCGQGEVEISVNCEQDCESDQTVNVILTEEKTAYTVPLKATGDVPSGEVCVKSYFSNVCQAFELDVRTENVTDGFVTTTTEETSKSDTCLTCWSSWFGGDLSFGGIQNTLKSILIIIVYGILCVIGLVISVALLKELLAFAMRSLFWKDKSS